ncbi:Uncharacterized protein dnl_02400 [Desulfonema limicola]|uniref:Flagellar assembly protein T N-terminal domain-containing protein n=1 Tax=Desulfonema limicola TaxID=45656 RepID=A0A975B3C7_9BACT|nr:hypothetical protein [Desulfonema limicola]QTA78032.1 Uncharacterized protein dnl_02400 [Desulfonema limicola]
MSYKFHQLILNFLILILCLLPFAAIAQENGQIQDHLQDEAGFEPENNIALVIGTAPVHNKNTAKAREDAITSGMVLSVEQVALTLFSPETLSGNFSKFLSILNGHAQDFIENYEVLAELESGSKYFMMIRAAVSKELLQNKLSGFTVSQDDNQVNQEDQNKTKILFLIAEQDLENIAPEYWWGENRNPPAALAEKAMADKMKALGFSIIDHGNGPPDVNVAAAIIFEPDLDNREAVNIGKVLNADISVVGKAIVYKVMDTSDQEVPSFNATLTFRAINLKTGEEITSILETAVKKNADEIQGSKDALQTAAAAGAEKLAAYISKISGSGRDTSGRMELIIKGAGNLGNFVRFRQMLSSAEGVKDIQIHEIKSNQAFISIDFKQSPQKLAETLARQQFELFNIKIDQADDKHLNIELIEK